MAQKLCMEITHAKLYVRSLQTDYVRCTWATCKIYEQIQTINDIKKFSFICQDKGFKLWNFTLFILMSCSWKYWSTTNSIVCQSMVFIFIFDNIFQKPSFWCLFYFADSLCSHCSYETSKRWPTSGIHVYVIFIFDVQYINGFFYLPLGNSLA